MEENVSLEHVLGGIAAILDELQETNLWLHRIYNLQMTIMAHDAPEIFEKVNLVHNELNMFMEDNWEEKLQ